MTTVDSEHELCTCTHSRRLHRRDGRCTGTDSYDQRCACPSFERDPDNDLAN